MIYCMSEDDIPEFIYDLDKDKWLKNSFDKCYTCLLYTSNRPQIIEKYSIKTGERSVIITKKEVLPVLANCLRVSMDDIKKISIEDVYKRQVLKSVPVLPLLINVVPKIMTVSIWERTAR